MLPQLIYFVWIPFVTALIGWLTNWVAIKMLFRPRDACRVLGLEMQGLIPRRQDELGHKLGEIIETELINAHTIRAQLDHIDFKQYLEAFTHRLIRYNLAKKLSTIPLVGSMINDATLDMLEGMAIEAMQQEVTPIKDKIAHDLESHLDIKAVVHQRIAAFEIDKLEGIIAHVAKKEFRAIEILGGVLGFVVGLAQVAILLLI